MELMQCESDSDYSSDSNSDSSSICIIDLTAGDDTTSVAEFVDLSKTPEVANLCCSNSSATSSSASTTSSSSSVLKPWGLLQRCVGDSSDRDIFP